MTHVVVGYPSLEATLPLAHALIDGGSDFLELQIPFSDPLVDGPSMMHACDEAIKQAITIQDVFRTVRELSHSVSIPLLLMGYYNSIFHYGLEAFCKKASEAGVSGLIFPDVPIDEEEYEQYIATCSKYNLYPIRVLSPASTEKRLKRNADHAQGFVYCVSRYGVTSAQEELDPRLTEYLATVRKHINLPLAVGFGISKQTHIQALYDHAEIAVVGSAVIDIIRKHKSADSYVLQQVKQFITRLKNTKP